VSGSTQFVSQNAKPGNPGKVYIGVGANLGEDPLATVIAGLRHCASLPGISQARSSSIYRSAPVEAQGPMFFNAVLEARSSLEPHDLLHALRAIEEDFGRERPYNNAPRTLDLDILLIDEQRINSPTLTVPHPRMHQRAFVLRPLLELAPTIHIPGHPDPTSLLSALGHQWIAPDLAPIEFSPK
jgi:2-amino-4-hydroxy-6-hydroxymethyldihydropteridine diphosphokinase